MKRSKRIYILLGVLAVSCMATLGVMKWEEEKEKIKNSDEIILALSGDQIQTLSWEYESVKLAFHKDEKWFYDEDEAFPVDEEKIGELLEQFQEFGVSFVIKDVEDYSQYGLDDPVCAIHLGTEEETFDIFLGRYSSMDSQRYVSVGDGNAYLVKHDPLNVFDVTLRDMIDHDEIPQFEKAARIQFEGTENYSVEYEEDSSRTYSAEDVYFTQREGNTLPLDTSRVNGYLRDMSGLSLTDYVTYYASDEELETYGLMEPELKVTVEYSLKEDEEEESKQFVLRVSRDPKEKKDTQNQTEDGLEETEEEVTAYARVGESRIVYRISSEEYRELMRASYDSLRHKEVFWADAGEIRQVDISLDGQVYQMTSKESKGERTYYYQDGQVDIFDFVNALGNVRADSFTTEQPAQKEEIGVTVYLDNENDPEVCIELYRYDGNSCLAVIDGEPVSLVPRSDVMNLAEAVYGIVLN